MATKVIYIGDYQPGKSICSGLDELGNTLKPKKIGIGNFWQKNNCLFGHYLNFFESCIQPTMYVINLLRNIYVHAATETLKCFV